MNLRPSQDLKPLYANFKRINIGRYLVTNNFDNLMLEMKIDSEWKTCYQAIQETKKSVIIDPLYRDYNGHEDAFYLLLSFFYFKNWDKFTDLFFNVIKHFILWTPIKSNLAQIFISFEALVKEKSILRTYSKTEYKKLKELEVATNSTKPTNLEKITPVKNQSKSLGDIFIVHGHNELLKTQVARFLEKLKLTPIILHEQASKGGTIIEKLENNSLNVGFAIILMTADDLGKKKDDDNLNARARQNVIFELGYFIAHLSRKNVATLIESGVEEPSDIKGVVYTQIDNRGAWQIELAKELKAAGYSIDLNQII